MSTPALLIRPERFESLPGRGVRGTVDGIEIAVGGLKLMADLGLTVSADLEDAVTGMEGRSLTAFLTGWDGEARAALGVADELRASSAPTVRVLQQRGIRVARRTVMKYREQLGIPASRQRRAAPDS